MAADRPAEAGAEGGVKAAGIGAAGRGRKPPPIRFKAEPPAPAALSSPLRAALHRWNLCRTFVHQFAVIARRATAPIIKRRAGQGRGEAWTPWRVAPPRQPGLAAIKHAQQRPERIAAMRGAFRRAGAMTRGELYEYFKRTGQLAVFYRLYPSP